MRGWPKYSGSLDIMVGQNSELDDPDSASIQLIDEASGTVVANVRLSTLWLFQAFRGRGRVPCTFQLQSVGGHIGKRHESKVVKVRIPDEVINSVAYQGRHRLTDEDRAIIRDAVKALCTDGWEPHEEDVFNHHNYERDGEGGRLVRLAFHRYVDQPAPAEAPVE